MLPVVGLLYDKLRGIVLGLFVLHHTLGIGGYAVTPAIVAMHMNLV